MKDPAFLFYPGDFDSKTKFFTHEQVGMYLRLLMAQFHNGAMSEDEMIFICGRKDDKVFSKFDADENGKFFNERLKIEIEKRRKFCQSRRDNLNSKDDTKPPRKPHMKPHMDTHMGTHMDDHMENRNRNRIKDEDVNRIYDAYPSKCPYRNTSTGKSSKDKDKIKKLLEKYSEADLLKIIKCYLADCEPKQTYLKNFSTFLNNLPIDFLTAKVPVTMMTQEEKTKSLKAAYGEV